MSRASPPALRTNRDRLWESLTRMAQIGALPGGGCCRLALSEEDGRARRQFAAWCEELNCVVSCDAVGNLYALRQGVEADLPVIATGSHLDTQPHGGRFDGVYGVMAALEVLRCLNDANVRTRRGVLAVVWTNEEGVRFAPPLAGSQAFCGRVAPQTVLNARTRDGTRVADDLIRLGQAGEETPGARRFECFLEAHIEQGPVLEAQAKTIGVVTQIQGIRAFRAQLTGEDGHAGTVPLSSRRDALVCAAEMIVRLRQMALEADPITRMTVGSLEVSPNAMSTIPGSVTFTIDLRHPAADTLSRVAARLQEELQSISARHGVIGQIQPIMASPPIRFDESLVGLVEACAARLGHSSMRMVSGAFHDAGFISGIAPTAMIFVPCAKGISHNEQESAEPADLAAGADVLLSAVLARAEAL